MLSLAFFINNCPEEELNNIIFCLAYIIMEICMILLTYILDWQKILAFAMSSSFKKTTLLEKDKCYHMPTTRTHRINTESSSESSTRKYFLRMVFVIDVIY